VNTLHSSLGVKGDPADSYEASYDHHPVDDIEPIDQHREIGWIEKVLMIMQSHERCYINDCLFLCLPSGVAYVQGMSMTEVAEFHGKTKAAVSKQCKAIRKELNLPPSEFMRKDAEIFKKTNMPRCKDL